MWRLSNDLTRNHIFKNPIRKVQEVRQLGCNETWRYLRGINRSFDFGSFGGGVAMKPSATTQRGVQRDLQLSVHAELSKGHRKPKYIIRREQLITASHGKIEALKAQFKQMGIR